MSATSNKSRILLFMMIVVALVFFLTSFLAAVFSNGPATTPTGTFSEPQSVGSSCITVLTAENRLYADCPFS